jgi:hypothetical protein
MVWVWVLWLVEKDLGFKRAEVFCGAVIEGHFDVRWFKEVMREKWRY